MNSITFSQTQYFGNTLDTYIFASGVVLGTLISLYIARTIIVQWLKNVAHKTTTEYDDIIIAAANEFNTTFFLAVSLYAGIRYINIAEKVNKGLETVIYFICLIYFVKAINIVLSGLLKKYIQKTRGEDDTSNSIETIVMFAVKVLLWGLGLAFILQNLDIQVTAILGGLGIGGIAVAFALQSVLGDLLSFFSIYFDKPFEVGDFIVTGDTMGTVEHIGVKSTRLKALRGEEVVIPNAEMIGSQINNYRKLKKRRVSILIGIEYETSDEKIKLVPELIKQAIENTDKTEFDRAHFYNYGEYALEYEFVYFALTEDYNEYMDIRQQINLGILESFNEHKINFAYPTKKLFVNNTEN